jgi:hypothetical protein
VARGAQLGGRFGQLGRFARTDQQARTGFAQRVRQLQAQATRAAGDERAAPAQVVELLNGAVVAHGRLL